MTSELIERVARSLWIGEGYSPEHWDGTTGRQWAAYMFNHKSRYYDLAQAAIRVIAPAVLEEAIAQCEWPEEAELNNEFARGMATACCLNRDAIRALKTRYEQ